MAVVRRGKTVAICRIERGAFWRSGKQNEHLRYIGHPLLDSQGLSKGSIDAVQLQACDWPSAKEAMTGFSPPKV